MTEMIAVSGTISTSEMLYRYEEQAYAMLFLCSDAAVAITGITLLSDAGWLTAGITGSFPPATPIASILLNRPPAYDQGALT